MGKSRPKPFWAMVRLPHDTLFTCFNRQLLTTRIQSRTVLTHCSVSGEMRSSWLVLTFWMATTHVASYPKILSSES